MPLSRSAWLRLAPLVATVWFGALVAHTALAAAAPFGILRDARLGWPARLTLVAWEAVAIAIAIGLLALPAWALAALGRRGPRSRVLARLGLALITAAVVLAWAASWASFWIGGRFLDAAGLEFYLGNAGIVFGYALELYPLELRLLPVAALATGLVVTVGLPRLLAGVGSAGGRRAALAIALSVTVVTQTALAGELLRMFDDSHVVDPESGVDLRFDRYYEMRRNFRAGPLTHAFVHLNPERELADDPVVGSAAFAEASPRALRTAAAHAALSGGVAPRPYDVVLILVDSLRPDQLRVQGASRDVMPTLDAIARESRVYTDTYTNGSVTDLAAPCPLTSHYPLRGRKRAGLKELSAYPRVLLHELLVAHGYRAAVAVSNNEFWGGTVHLLWSRSLDFFLTAGVQVPREGPDLLHPSAPHVDDAFTVDAALDWISALEREPLFLYLNFQNAHVPFVVPEGFPRPFGRKLPFVPRMGAMPAERVRPSQDAWADALHYVDFQIGRVVERLKAVGRWERTVLVVSADHGQAFGEHGVGGHGGYPWDEVMRVPLIVRAPGLEAGLDATPAELIDVAPTITGLLGLPPHPAFQGVDLRDPRLPRPRSRYLLSQTPIANAYAVVRDGYKLVFDADTGRFALFHLATDPGERTDLVAARPEVVRALAARLEGWRHAQARYYADRERWRHEYPPTLLEN